MRGKMGRDKQNRRLDKRRIKGVSRKGPSRMQARVNGQETLHVYVCSTHPLVITSIQSQLISQPFHLEATMAPSDLMEDRSEAGIARILILDKYSLSNWRTVLSKWNRCGIRAIALLPKESSPPSDLLSLFDAGIWGIVWVSTSLAQDLPAAILSVSQGTPWLEYDLQKKYLAHNSTRLSLMPKEPLTEREQQILNLLIRRQTNQDMKTMIGISERTIRFHTSNVLRKLDLANRKALFAIGCNEQMAQASAF